MSCGATHYAGCKCHEAGWRRRVDQAEGECINLRMQLSQQAERVLSLETEVTKLRAYVDPLTERALRYQEALEAIVADGWIEGLKTRGEFRGMSAEEIAIKVIDEQKTNAARQDCRHAWETIQKSIGVSGEWCRRCLTWKPTAQVCSLCKGEKWITETKKGMTQRRPCLGCTTVADLKIETNESGEGVDDA